MDLAESILFEITTLQKKNEDLVKIILRLEHESDVIIHQFEEKISELNKHIKKTEDNAIKYEKRYDTLVYDSEHEKTHLKEQYEAHEELYQKQLKETDSALYETKQNLSKKELLLVQISKEKEDLQDRLTKESENYNAKILAYKDLLDKEKTEALSQQKHLKSEYELLLQKINTECQKKDNELRVLAGEIKNQNLLKEGEISEWNEKLNNSLKVISEKENEIKKEKEFRKQREDDDKIIFDKLLRNNHELEDKINELEDEIIKQKDVFIIQRNAQEMKIKELNEKNSTFSLKIDDLVIVNTELKREYHETQVLIQRFEEENEILNKKYQDTLEISKKRYKEFEDEIAFRDLTLSESRERIGVLETSCEQLTTKVEINEKNNNDIIQNLRNQCGELEKRNKLLLIQKEEEKTSLSEKILDLNSELDKISLLKEEHEEEYQNEIEEQRSELNRVQEEIKDLQTSYHRESSEKDRQISLISGNNEALRSELERVRSRLLLLEKTIRDEKEEPVQALFRQIQNLSLKLAEIESKNSILSERVIRLDTENTRLSKILAGSTRNGEFLENGINNDNSPKKSSKISTEILLLLSKLEDPHHSLETALEIIRMGSDIVDLLIPMLYRGNLQRRAWIAAILYEINDPRSVKPLTELLATPDTHLRELIWDTRVKFREWKRTGSISMLA
jgi:hypothetical protein